MRHLYEETTGTPDQFFTKLFAGQSYSDVKWGGAQSPSTILLRKMILLCDWASKEPKRWQAYNLDSRKHITRNLIAGM